MYTLCVFYYRKSSFCNKQRLSTIRAGAVCFVLSVYPVHLAVQIIQALVVIFVMCGGILYVYVNYVVVVYAESPVARPLVYKFNSSCPQACSKHPVRSSGRAAPLYIA